jgi:hypothetical protein
VVAIFYLRHMPPALHPVFFCSSGLTLNAQADGRDGYCPVGPIVRGGGVRHGDRERLMAGTP